MADGRTSVDVGIAGSITMIVITLAFTLLMVSFYRRYKRASEKSDDK
mgnify:CR=1 FL=1